MMKQRFCEVCSVDISGRLGQTKVCSEACKAAKAKARYEANRAQILARTKEYQAANRSKINAKKRERFQRNPEERIKRRDRESEKKAQNPELFKFKRREAARRRREQDPEAYYAKSRGKQRDIRRSDEYRAKRRQEYAEMSAARKVLKEMNLL
ncbi:MULTISPECIES: hypothetical protein [Rhizobium/Agrobacterium group]|uniref:hypothetical protein n=1 Tax=Rhizobium/Agrobacterium group TaxID=227290 RepID=UPI00059FEC32|nr:MULTISPECIES: hypothetical protein [Rhizobium/Agrobacterium group]MUO30824.1 hypothetical protein [Agrobacterium vitis]